MKTVRTLAAATALLMGATALSAQNFNDAINLGVNDYYGTARTLSMGNAFTALGGDLGSVGINPAGSAVNSYSQFTLTPSISISATRSDYYGDLSGSTPALSNMYGTNKMNSTRLTLPNIGFLVNMKTGRSYGLKSFSFGFVSNATASFNNEFEGYGYNYYNSMTGAFAQSADGYSTSALASDDWGVDYGSGMIGQYGTYSDGSAAYIGAAENLYTDGIGLARTLNQGFGRSTYGYKHDLVFNFGGNINDKLYLGANLGIVAVSMSSSTFTTEAVDPTLDADTDDNKVYYYDTWFRSASYNYNYDMEGSGIYGKFGVIYLPTPSLRLGAAVQTPTSITVTGYEWCAAETTFSDASYTGYDSSDDWEFGYRLITPWRFNVGAAYTFGGKFLVSADYEFTDFSTMKFKAKSGYNYTSEETDFAAFNSELSDYAGIAHQLRLGAEYKVTPAVSLRAGYNLLTSPEYAQENGSKKSISANTHSVALGGGYSSTGSFFCDLALRAKFLPVSSVYPYGSDVVPVVDVKTNKWDIVATFGWRF